MSEPKPDDKRLYNKNRNPVTGDRLVTKPATEQYKDNFDKIKWGKNKEDK